MKDVCIRVEIKQGLPNYSSRTAEVTRVADESESLDIVKMVRDISASIKKAWGEPAEPTTIAVKLPEAATPTLPAVTAVDPKNPKAGNKPVPEAKPDNVVELKPKAPVKRASNPLDED